MFLYHPVSYDRDPSPPQVSIYHNALLRIDIIKLPLPAPNARQALTPASTCRLIFHLVNSRR